MSEMEKGSGEAKGLEELADVTEHSIKAIKDLVMDVRLFGRQG